MVAKSVLFWHCYKSSNAVQFIWLRWSVRRFLFLPKKITTISPMSRESSLHPVPTVTKYCMKKQSAPNQDWCRFVQMILQRVRWGGGGRAYYVSLSIFILLIKLIYNLYFVVLKEGTFIWMILVETEWISSGYRCLLHIANMRTRITYIKIRQKCSFKTYNWYGYKKHDTLYTYTAKIKSLNTVKYQRDERAIRQKIFVIYVSYYNNFNKSKWVL